MTLKRRGVDFKGFLIEAIVPSSGTQPSTLLRREGALPCKVVITSTHALPCIPGGSYGESSPNGWRTSQLGSLIDDLRCTVSGVGAFENPMKQKRKHIGYTNILKSSSRLYKSSKFGLQSASICRPPPECSQTQI